MSPTEGAPPERRAGVPVRGHRVGAALTAVTPVAVSRPAAAAPAEDWLHVEGNQIVDEAGNPVWLTGANWFGLNATERAFHGLWSANIVTITQAMAERGINIVRVPISTQLLLEWKAGTYVMENVNTYENPELLGMNGLEIFDYWLGLCEQYGLKVLLDVHSAEADTSGHVYPVWYKGSITSKPGWWVTSYRDNDHRRDGRRTSPTAERYSAGCGDGSTDADNWKNTCQVAGAGSRDQPEPIIPARIEDPRSGSADPDRPVTTTATVGGNLRGVVTTRSTSLGPGPIWCTPTTRPLV